MPRHVWSVLRIAPLGGGAVGMLYVVTLMSCTVSGEDILWFVCQLLREKHTAVGMYFPEVVAIM